MVAGQRFILVGFYNADGRDRAGEECGVVHDREKKIPTWQLRLHTNTNAKGHTRWMEEGELISEYDVRPGCTIFIDRDAADGEGYDGDLDPMDAWTRL